MGIMEWLSQPWHWSVSGLMIALIMFTINYLGHSFGMSSTLRTLCAVGGAGKKVEFFNFDWKEQLWNIVIASGAVLGGIIATTWLQSPEPVQVAVSTTEYLATVGIEVPTTYTEGGGFVPMEIFRLESLFTLKGFVLMVVGGFFIGFGTRWAGGCTSGHAISGLSNFQLPSLIAVVGFFIGGLLMTHLFMPFILNL